jgi:hypothetical protein
VLWKTVQIFCSELRAERLHKRRPEDAVTPPAASLSACLRACSACAGDYEDPERTASGDAREEGRAEDASADDAERSVPRDEFPAREK